MLTFRTREVQLQGCARKRENGRWQEVAQPFRREKVKKDLLGLGVLGLSGKELFAAVPFARVVPMRRIGLLWMMAALGAVANADDGQRIFDGKTLNGWLAQDMSFWSVEDGAITAKSAADHPCAKNQFLVWQGGEIGDFELTLQFRLDGGPQANSGVQVRSKMFEDGHAEGYQADITQPAAPYLGAIYDEHGRKMLAKRGQTTIIREDGKMESQPIQGAEQLLDGVDLTQWTAYRIVFEGPRMTVELAGKKTAEILDLQESEREMSGILALQLHSGPPMKVQFRDVVLKKLAPKAAK